MKKDYIYQDKDQFKLLQNGERIGSFYAGDQGIVPAERVLPEQRFAHQPIFRRPPEELVTVFSYIHNFNQGVFSLTNHDIKVANLFKKSSTTNPDGVHLLYKYTGWADAPYLQKILLKNWSAEAKATKIFVSNSCQGNWNVVGSVWEGVVLTTFFRPVFFKDYVFFQPPFIDAVYYSKLNAKKIETKEVKVAVQESNREFYQLCWLYEDSTDSNYRYKMVVYKQDGPFEPARRWTGAISKQGFSPDNFDTGWLGGESGTFNFNPATGIITVQGGCGDIWIRQSYGEGIPSYTEQYTMGNYSENLVQYKANSLEGPWVYDKTWDTYALDRGSPAYTTIIQELASLILSKTHKNLSMAVSDGGYYVYEDVLSEVYAPPYTTSAGASVYSRGNEGEIVRIFTPPAKNYLIKRQGDGQMKKTLITDIDAGYFD